MRAFVVLAFGLAACSRPEPEAPAEATVTVVEAASPLQGWDLTDANGEPFTEAELKGRRTAVVVGTAASKVSRATLSVLGEVMPMLPELHVVFVDVDPTEDAAVLNAMVAAKAPGVRALRGPQRAIDPVMASLRTAYAVSTTAPGIDHSTSVVLVDERAIVVAYVHRPNDASRVLADVKGQFKNP